MKKHIKEKREKAILESFAKNFNKIKRFDEQEVDEINIGKGIASLGLAATLAGSPSNASSQVIPTKSIETPIPDTPINISAMSNEKAAVTILLSYTKNPFSAETWGQQGKENIKLFKILKKMLEYRMNTGRFEEEELEALGAKYKTTPIAQSFLSRDTKNKSTYTMREDDLA